MIDALSKAAQQGRYSLLEHEVYDCLQKKGFSTPQYHFLAAGEQPTQKLIDSFSGEKLVLKIVSPLILHKSDVGGVRIVERSLEAVQDTVSEFLRDIPARMQEDLKKNPHHYPTGCETASFSEALIGVLLLEFVDSSGHEFGKELFLGMRNTREFGPVVTFGVGGIDAEFYSSNFKSCRAHAIRSLSSLDNSGIGDLAQQPAIYRKISGQTRDAKASIALEPLTEAVTAFCDAVREVEESGSFQIEEFEMNPLVVRDGRLLPLDGLLSFRKPEETALPRPLEKIGNLLDAKTFGLIGVSQKMNLGHIILKNLLDYGIPAEKITVVKPEEDAIEGVVCVPDAASMPFKVDAFVVCVAAAQVKELIADLIEHDKAHSVVLIPGGLGEKSGTASVQDEIKDLVKTARSQGEAPVLNGGNCLGLYSQTAGYSTLFVPEYKFARPLKHESRKKIGLISQSGAFMIARMARLPYLNFLWAVSTGNQIDLTVADYLEYMGGQDVELLAAYVEGFQEGDGERFAAITKELTKAGTPVVVYKAGRTPAGAAAASGHTASIAGDYAVFDEVMRASGAEVAETVDEFENLLIFHTFFADRPFCGNRIGIVSNAGFEAVGIADNLQGVIGGVDYKLEIPAFDRKTSKRILETFKEKRIDSLVDIHNPLDLTPMADDSVWIDSVCAMLEDTATDMVLVTIVPLTPAMQSVEPGPGHKEDLNNTTSLAKAAQRLANDYKKPLVVSIDGGGLYDAYAKSFFDAGIPVFRTADRAARFLGRLSTIMSRK